MKKFSEIREIAENLTSGGGQGATYSSSPLGIANAADEPDKRSMRFLVQPVHEV